MMPNRAKYLKATWLGLLAGIGAAQLAGCSARQSNAPVSPSSARSAPVPPLGAVPDLSLPASNGAGGFKTLNSGIAPGEAVWHVRSALNVAALACDDPSIVSNYNALLKRQKAVFAAAHRSESRHFGSAAAMDSHMTKLYNFFAQPPTQRLFCVEAREIAREAQSVPAGQFEQFAARAIERLDRPFQDFYRVYQLYQRDLAAWRASGGAAERIALARPASDGKGPPSSASPWRVQLGAFSGSVAARSAWIEIRRRAPGLASFQPLYEPASVKGLVRLQVGPVNDRREALRLCAAAAAAALDCLPVPD